MSTRSYVVNTGADYLKVSDDKGATWQTIVPSGYPSIANILSISADPFNSYKAIICTQLEGLWLTEDAGNSFIQVSGTSGITFKSIYFIDSFRILAVGDQIFRSVDGGLNFSPTGVSPSLLYGSSGPLITANNISFGAYAVGFISVYDKLYKSYDAGLTWSPANSDLALVSGKSIFGIRHLNDNNSVAVVVESNGIYTSTDGGETFTLAFSIPSLSGLSNYLFGNRINTDAWFIDSGQNTYFSPDSTVTWTAITPYPNSGAYIQRIFAFTTSTAIIAGAGSAGSGYTGIYTTNDGGTTLSLEEDYAGRLYGLSSNYEYNCGECSNKAEFNPVTGLCEVITNSGPLCPPGYTYDSVSNSCVSDTVSTYYPKDIAISRDQTSSVQTSNFNLSANFCNPSAPVVAEWNQMTIIQSDIISALSTEITAGDIQVSVLEWAETNSSTSLSFSSSLVDIENAICQQKIYGGLTNTALGLYNAYNELINGTTQNPSAEKIMLFFTDGTQNVFGGTFTVGSTIITVGTADTDAVRNLATAIKNEGVKIILIALGDQSELNDIYNEYVNKPDPLPSTDANGNLMYISSLWADAGDIVDLILNNVNGQETLPVPECPPECSIYIDPDTSEAYCQCIEEYAIVPCCYELVDCAGSEQSIITQTDLSDYYSENQIITIEGSDTCWQINLLDSICPISTPVIVVDTYATCENCLPSYTLFHCHDVNTTINTSEDLSQDLGQTIIISAYPNDCWQVGPNTSQSYNFQSVTIVGESYQNCDDCSKPLFQLTNCLNPEAIVITDTDLTQYLDSVVSVEGFVGLCFTVSFVECNCIKITLDGDTYTSTALTQINGRNAYIIDLGSESVTLAWDQDANQWSLFNSETEVLYAYTTLDVECPFTSFWIYEEGSPFTEIVVSYCVDEIFDVTISSEFPNCDYCVNC